MLYIHPLGLVIAIFDWEREHGRSKWSTEGSTGGALRAQRVARSEHEGAAQDVRQGA